MTYFATNLKALRKSLGYSQEKFAELLNVKRSTYANYETGGEPNIDFLIHLKTKFGIDLNDFLLDIYAASKLKFRSDAFQNVKGDNNISIQNTRIKKVTMNDELKQVIDTLINISNELKKGGSSRRKSK